MKRLFLATAAVLLLVLGSGGAWSQAIQPLLNYQGRLTDEGGVPLAGFVTMRFTIKSYVSSPDCQNCVGAYRELWRSTRTNVPLSDGYFSLNLGEQEPLPTNLLGQDVRLALQVEEIPEFDTEFKLTWSPFAMTALDSRQLNGLDPEYYDQSLHVLDMANPHAVTASQVGAMSEQAIAAALADKAAADHGHDEIYYRKADIDGLLGALGDRVETLESQLDALTQAGDDASFGGAIRREGDDLIFEGVNINIRNGTGETGQRNGLGNLIIGYNLAQAADEPVRLRGGSHNVVIGDLHSYRGYASLAAGANNRAGSPMTVVTGVGNTAYGDGSVVLGGARNVADDDGAVLIGGQDNAAYRSGDMVIGGHNNGADAGDSIIIGGVQNTTNVPGSQIVGRSHVRTRGDNP